MKLFCASAANSDSAIRRLYWY